MKPDQCSKSVCRCESKVVYSLSNMKILAVVLIAMAVVGSSWGEVKGGGDCPIEEEEFMIYNTLVKMAIKCLVPDDKSLPTLDFLFDINNLDETSDFLKNYCQLYPEPVSKCLNQVKGYWEKCHDEEERHDFRLLSDFFETTLEIVCFEDGESLFRMILELQPSPENEGHYEGVMPFVTDCMRDVGVEIFTGDDPLRERLFSAYRRLNTLRKCFAMKGKNTFLSTREITSIIGKIYQKMKCLHPISKKFVLCSSLNWDGTRDRQCPERFNEKDQKYISQILIDEGMTCFFPRPKDLGVDISQDQLNTEFFINYCENLTDVKDCLAEVTLSAKLCLSNETRHKSFEIYQEMLETSLEIGCRNDGVQLATIFIANFDRSSSSVDVVGECKDISMTKIKHVPEFDQEDAATLSLRMYQEVGAFEDCIAKDIQSASFREVAHTYTNDVMNKIKCVDPIDGRSVLCKSIVDSF